MRKKLIPSHQKAKSRKTPGEPSKRKIRKIEMLALLEITYSRIVTIMLDDDEERPEWDWLKKKTKS